EDGYTVPVENGLFTVFLEIPPTLFDGQALWLGVQVEGDAQEMTPRQQLLPAPYALYANAGSGAAAWLLGGNADTTPGTDVLGTTDAVSLTLVVSGTPALRLEPATVPNLIGGYRGNSVTSGVEGATISGGGNSSHPNQVTADYGTIGGGEKNTASGADATIGGGVENAVSGIMATVGGGVENTASGDEATVGGGSGNSASGFRAIISGGSGNSASGFGSAIGGGAINHASGDWTTVGGGYSNTSGDDYTTIGGGYDNTASGDYATISGGQGNTTSGFWATVGGGEANVVSGTLATIGGGEANTASGTDATVSGGVANTASGMDATVSGGYANTASGTDATVGGGYANTASGEYATGGGGKENTASGYYTTIGGGESNTASGDWATIAGGQGNTASGDYSFVAGRRANAIADGCFVWGDSTDATFNCSNPNRFMVRASGGVYLYTNSTVSTGAYLAPNSGSWSSLSDRNAKENFQSVDPEYVLEQVVQMPVSTWNYIGEAEGIRHLGPMAQDFYAAFGLGDSERYINTLDADGVALAAIQGLYAKNQALAAENTALQTRVDDLETENAAQEKTLSDLETRLAVLERGGTPQAVSTLTTWWPLAGMVVLAGIVVARRRR
ncbi:MAG: tail fiber domain-containing protein, partial [Anaerolineae bacterium]